jgi:hypothetical protein
MPSAVLIGIVIVTVIVCSMTVVAIVGTMIVIVIVVVIARAVMMIVADKAAAVAVGNLFPLSLHPVCACLRRRACVACSHPYTHVFLYYRLRSRTWARARHFQ